MFISVPLFSQSLFCAKDWGYKVLKRYHPSHLGTRVPVEDTDVFFDVTVEIITGAPRDDRWHIIKEIQNHFQRRTRIN